MLPKHKTSIRLMYRKDGSVFEAYYMWRIQSPHTISYFHPLVWWIIVHGCCSQGHWQLLPVPGQSHAKDPPSQYVQCNVGKMLPPISVGPEQLPTLSHPAGYTLAVVTDLVFSTSVQLVSYYRAEVAIVKYYMWIVFADEGHRNDLA